MNLLYIRTCSMQHGFRTHFQHCVKSVHSLNSFIGHIFVLCSEDYLVVQGTKGNVCKCCPCVFEGISSFRIQLFRKSSHSSWELMSRKSNMSHLLRALLLNLMLMLSGIFCRELETIVSCALKVFLVVAKPWVMLDKQGRKLFSQNLVDGVFTCFYFRNDRS